VSSKPPVLKCVLAGEGGVGKTSITLRYIENRFDDSMRMTVGANFASENVTVGKTTITMMLWDLGGQPRFHDVVQDYFKGAEFGIAVYDVNRAYTLERLE
jgi:small GTP-binding protein